MGCRAERHKELDMTETAERAHMQPNHYLPAVLPFTATSCCFLEKFMFLYEKEQHELRLLKRRHFFIF